MSSITREELLQILSQRVPLDVDGNLKTGLSGNLNFDTAGLATDAKLDAILAILNATGPSPISAESGTVYINGVPYAVKKKIINATASGSNDIIPAVTGKKLRVLSYDYTLSADGSVTWGSGASATALSGPKTHFQGGGMSCGDNPHGWIETASGEKLVLVNSGAFTTGGELNYIEV